MHWSILFKFWWNDNYIKFAKQWWKPHLSISNRLGVGIKNKLLLQWQNQQHPLLSIYQKVGCFWPNLEFDFFAYIFPAIYGVCRITVESFVRWPLRTAFTDCFQCVICFPFMVSCFLFHQLLWIRKKKEENELNEMVKNTINPSKKQLMSYSGATWPWNWVPLDPSYRFQP